MRQHRTARRALVQRQTCPGQGQCSVHAFRKGDLLRGGLDPMSRSLPPCPTALRLRTWSARQDHDGLTGRCEAGAAPVRPGVAPTRKPQHRLPQIPVSPEALPVSLAGLKGKVSTAGRYPRSGWVAPSPLPIPISAVLTIIDGRGAFLCLSPTQKRCDRRTCFRLQATGRAGFGERGS